MSDANAPDATDTEARAAWLTTRFGEYEGVSTEQAQRELLQMGRTAIPALVDTLASADGWTAAKLLGLVGAADPEAPLDDAIAALRTGADHPWFARALGILGDTAWLLAQPNAVAVPGLAGPLLDVAWNIEPSWPRVPLRFGPAETWLATADAEGIAALEDALRPGRSYVPIAHEDVAEALRGLGSRHPVVRWVAASMLGAAALGREVGGRVLPRLADRLTDSHRLVRRLAVLAIDRWSRLGAPYLDAAEPLRSDPDAVVRSVAAAVLNRRA